MPDYERVSVSGATIYTLVPFTPDPEVREYDVQTTTELAEVYRQLNNPEHAEEVIDVVIERQGMDHE